MKVSKVMKLQRFIFVVGSHAYLADGDAGLRVIDVSDPGAPVEVGAYDTPDRALDVHVAGTFAYVADRWAGLRVIDVADPSTPVQVGYAATPGPAEGVFVIGTHAYVAADSFGLRVMDISNPAGPTEVGAYDTPGLAQDVFVTGGPSTGSGRRYAYVADLGSGIRVVDVSDPTRPVEVGAYDTPGFAEHVSVAGDLSTGSGRLYAYVADVGGGLRVIDVSEPATPVEVATYDTPGTAWGVSAAGRHAYVADGSGGLVILKLGPSAPPSLELIGQWTDAPVIDIAAAGRHLYVAQGHSSGGVRVLDVSNPAHPTEIAAISDGGAPIAVTDHLLLTTAYKTLNVFEALDPHQPQRVATVSLRDEVSGGRIRAVDVSGDYAYAGLIDSDTNFYMNGGVSIVDLTDPANAWEIAGYGDGRVFAVLAADNRVYSASGGIVPGQWSGIRITDVSDPAHPQRRGSIGSTSGLLAARDNTLYVASGESLYVYDVADPDGPQLRTRLAIGVRDSAMTLAGDYLFLRCGEKRLCVLSIANRWHPQLRGGAITPMTDISTLEVAGDKLYVGSSEGLLVYQHCFVDDKPCGVPPVYLPVVTR